MTLHWFSKAAILLAAPLLPALAAAQDEGVRQATAIVNGEAITGTDVEHRLALILANRTGPLPPEEAEQARALILRDLIDETLQIQAARQQEIAVDSGEVDAYFQRVAQSMRRTPEEFSAYLRSIRSSDRSLKRQIRGELAWQRLQRRQLDPRLSVGEEEVREVMERLEAERGTSEYRVAEILVSATPETAARVQAELARIAAQLRAGASFEAYARQTSEATTAAAGGDLGWVRAGQLAPERAAAVTAMEVGAISDPIAVPGGFWIAGLADRRRILVADPRDATLSLVQLAIPTTGEQAEARARQLGAATRAMGGCGRARQVAAALGAALTTNDQVRARDLPRALQPMVLALGIGQATPVFGSAEEVSVLVLCGRDDPPAPTALDIENSILERRAAQWARGYLRELRRNAVIDYR